MHTGGIFVLHKSTGHACCPRDCDTVMVFDGVGFRKRISPLGAPRGHTPRGASPKRRLFAPLRRGASSHLSEEAPLRTSPKRRLFATLRQSTPLTRTSRRRRAAAPPHAGRDAPPAGEGATAAGSRVAEWPGQTMPAGPAAVAARATACGPTAGYPLGPTFDQHCWSKLLVKRVVTRLAYA
jgi:hypothetical protein